MWMLMSCGFVSGMGIHIKTRTSYGGYIRNIAYGAYCSSASLSSQKSAANPSELYCQLDPFYGATHTVWILLQWTMSSTQQGSLAAPSTSSLGIKAAMGRTALFPPALIFVISCSEI